RGGPAAEGGGLQDRSRPQGYEDDDDAENGGQRRDFAKDQVARHAGKDDGEVTERRENGGGGGLVGPQEAVLAQLRQHADGEQGRPVAGGDRLPDHECGDGGEERKPDGIKDHQNGG